MPILYDLDEASPPDPGFQKLANHDAGERDRSETRVEAEYPDGPCSDSENDDPSLTKAVLAAINDNSLGVSDRVELIERIKRGESPTWMPNRTLEKYYQNHHDSPKKRSPEPDRARPSPLLPSVELKDPRRSRSPQTDTILASAAEIERPRSALHSGDFTERHIREHQDLLHPLSPPSDSTQTSKGLYSISPPAPWHYHSTTTSSSLHQNGSGFPPARPRSPDNSLSRSRAPSLSSLSSSFVYKPPTSPLVHSSNNPDLDFSPENDPIDIDSCMTRSSRRHTLPPHALLSLHSSPPSQLPPTARSGRPLASVRREVTFPYQAHQPRRSLTSNLNSTLDPAARTPLHNRARRPSLSSDVSPLQHAPLVGSYEESILRGRMSTVPSKPLDFMAQIGVLGLGDCKPHLRCPAHVSVPFPAVFYSYGRTSAGGTSSLEDGPSPYVGLVDLENSLRKVSNASRERRKRRHLTPTSGYNSPYDVDGGEADDQWAYKSSELQMRRREKKKKRRSTSPRAPPGGSYRIPQKGQLQIVIKNPNKTAVKLFLVPYDLQGMEAGTKTFIRQRSYSAGPIIDLPVPSKIDDLSPLPSSAKALDRPTLRYLIHMHICCPSRGRYYLYKTIRIVFANRVPDGKERLHNEIQLPEPRYSAYKPGRDSHNGAGSSAGQNLTAEKAFRRRSSNFVPVQGGLDAFGGISNVAQTFQFGSSLTAFSSPRTSFDVPLQAIPFTLTSTTPFRTPPGNRGDVEMDLDNPLTTRPPQSSISPGSRNGSSTSNSSYGKLSKGDVGYGGSSFTSSADGVECGEGLLARRLKGLDVQREMDQKDGL
ncbi:MAG: hypothetical protein M1833_000502 [Piccolia ochrophora]|nr:MAG: hypothetical protein M1833_000502 [Piccolia ochrophora]